MKYYSWPIIAGIVGGASSLGILIGPFFGALFGVVIGVPLYYLLVFVFEFITKRIKMRYNIAATAISCLIVIAAQWIIFYISPSEHFKLSIADPIPLSVKNIQARGYYIGTDYSKYLKFNINKRDLEKIISDNNFESATIEIQNLGDQAHFAIKSSNNSTFPFPGSLGPSPSWFQITEIENAKIYVTHRTGEHQASECLIYEPNTEVAFYEYVSY